MRCEQRWGPLSKSSPLTALRSRLASRARGSASAWPPLAPSGDPTCGSCLGGSVERHSSRRGGGARTAPRARPRSGLRLRSPLGSPRPRADRAQLGSPPARAVAAASQDRGRSTHRAGRGPRQGTPRSSPEFTASGSESEKRNFEVELESNQIIKPRRPAILRSAPGN
jgi:hypothetical protein